MPEPDERGRFENVARAALLEITTAETVGAYAGLTDEGEHTYSVRFEASQPGYPGWRWTVSITQLPDAEPSVLEAELLPAEGALLAPDWVPWADRLAEWEAAQAALAADSESDDDDLGDRDDDDFDGDDDSEDDDDDDDASDEDVLDDDEALLHSGDLDGVDIDDLDESDEDDSDEEE